MSPKVSVIIPTHNRPHLVVSAVRSVLAQTFQDLEIIIVDDGLEKRAEGALKNYLSNPKIKYIRHKYEMGGSAARNTGIRASKGTYVAFLDDDDEWLPEKLNIQMRAFDFLPHNVGFCYSSVINVHDDYEEITRVANGIKDHSDTSFRRLKGFLTVTLVFRKRVLKEFGGFDEALPSHQEAELILRVSQKYKGFGINQPLVRVNMRADHERIGTAPLKRIKGLEMIIEKHYGEFKKRPCYLARHYFQMGLWYRDGGFLGKAFKKFLQAFRTYPSWKYFTRMCILLVKGSMMRLR